MVGYAICIWSRTSLALGFFLCLNHENPIKVQRYESSNNSRPGLDRGGLLLFGQLLPLLTLLLLLLLIRRLRR